MRQHKFQRYLIAVCMSCIGLICLNLILSQKYISVTRYIYENPQINQRFKTVHLTDLHNYQFGAENYRLVQKVAKEEPNVIFLTGDMLNGDEDRTDILMRLIENLVQIAPVYASLGNHEIEYMERIGNKKVSA